jgi:hypothetical protein
MFYSEKRNFHHKLQMKCGTEGFFLPLEYEAEMPPFPEGLKVKQEAVLTVSTTWASAQIMALREGHHQWSMRLLSQVREVIKGRPWN